MAIGVHVEKEMQWRDQAERFENVYHFHQGPAGQGTAEWEALADHLVAQERLCHISGVTFVKVRIHGPTEGTQADDIMRFVKDYNLLGTQSNTSPTPRELAAVVQIYMGRSGAPHHRKTFLRKFWHSGGLPNSDSGGAFGNSALSTANRDFYKARLDALRGFSVGGVLWELSKPNGNRIPTGEAAVCLPHLHVRQLRR